MSHPVWVRGLKLIRHKEIASAVVAPRVGAWIETRPAYIKEFGKTSHPVWVRGLKPSFVVQQSKSSKSHPVWVRGLKPAFSAF